MQTGFGRAPTVGAGSHGRSAREREAPFGKAPLMPEGPRGEKRSADAIGRALMIAKIAIREIEDQRPLSNAAAELGNRVGRAMWRVQNGC